MTKDIPVTGPGMLSNADSPQIFDRPTTAHLFFTVIACLLPAAIWGIAMFGWYAGLIIAVSILSAMLAEFLVLRCFGRAWQMDGHAVMIGLLIGMVMPPTVPLFIPAAASCFAIALVKWPLGGLSSAWIHPAAAGWAFALLSWPREMGRFLLPSFFSGTNALVASPGTVIRNWLDGNAGGGMGPGDILNAQAYFHSAIDSQAREFLNTFVLSPLGASLPSGYVDAFLGIGPGYIGGVSSVLLLLGSIVLISRRVIRWQLPAGFFAVFAGLTFTFGGLPFGTGWFSGDVLYFALHGSFLLVLFFIATDLSTSPLTDTGHWVAGLILGLICFSLTLFGRAAEAAIVSVLLVNMLISVIDHHTRMRRTRLRRD